MASDIFAKIGDIKGESADDKHKGEIEVLSFSWGVSNSASITGAGGGAGKATFHDIVFTHGIDRRRRACCARARSASTSRKRRSPIARPARARWNSS
jgi:hypothetical protein